MAQAGIGWAQPDVEQQQIERQRALAMQLRQQGAQPLQGQNVGGVYVAPHWTQQLAKALSPVVANMTDKRADEQQRAYGEKLREQDQADLNSVTGLLTGTPGRTIQPATPNDDEGNAMSPVQVAAQPADMRKAYAAALSARNPALQQFGLQGFAQIPEMEARQAERATQRDFQREQMAAQNQARMEQAQMAHQLRMDQMAAQNASRQQMMEAQQAFQREMAQLRREAGASSQPYFQPLQTANGVMAFNARTGKIEPVVGSDGQAIVGAQADPSLQGRIAGAKSGAQVEAKATTEERIGAPKAVAQGEQTIKLVDDLLASPGFKTAVGMPRMLGMQNIPGTNAKDFDVRLDQLKGEQFMQAYQNLRGGGQITEVEGKKATDAISRMNASSSQKEFEKAARDFQDIVRLGVERAKKAQGGVTAAPSNAAPKRLRFDAQGNVLP